MVKNLPVMQETQVWSLGWEDPLEKAMVTNSSIKEFHGQRSLVLYIYRGRQSDRDREISLSIYLLNMYVFYINIYNI